MLSCRETFTPFFVFFYLEVVVVIVAVFFRAWHFLTLYRSDSEPDWRFGLSRFLEARGSSDLHPKVGCQAFVDNNAVDTMERSLGNGVASDFLHPHSPPHHVRRHLSPTLVSERPSSPSARRRRRQRKPWRKLLWVLPSLISFLISGERRLSRQLDR